MYKKGFLSAEALVMTALLAALASVCGLYISGGKLIMSSSNLTTAAFLAEKQMACIKGLLTENFALQGDVAWQDQEDKLPLLKNGTAFTVKTTVENNGARQKYIFIHVSWNELGIKKHIELESLALHGE